MESLRVVVFVIFVSSVSKFVSSAEDAITFTSIPDSITFNTVEALHSSEIADVFSSMLSYTLAKPYSWQCLGPVNPLKRPKAIFVLDVRGVGPKFPLHIQGTKFTLENLYDLDGQFALLALRTNERYGKGDQEKPVLLNINADDELYSAKSEYRALFKSIPADVEGRLEKAKEDPDLGRTLTENTFNTSLQPDSDFLAELETVKLLTRAIQANKATLCDGAPDIFLVKLNSLHRVTQQYGTDSIQAKEASRLMDQVVMETGPGVQNAYDNQAVIVVITETVLPYPSTRTARSLLQAKPVTESGAALKPYNYTAYEFDNDFDVAFALTAFTSIVLILTVFGVSVAIWFMDPGRDSIIYRMTSQRKKD